MKKETTNRKYLLIADLIILTTILILAILMIYFTIKADKIGIISYTIIIIGLTINTNIIIKEIKQQIEEK